MAVSSLTAVTNSATALGNLILVTPQNTIGYQPQATGSTSPNGPSLLFNYEGENTSEFSSDITDHFVEDNTAIQDQIALKPVMITVQGFVGELNNVPPNSFFAAAQKVANKLTGVSAYAPSLSVTALLAYNEALFAYQTAANVVNNAISTWSSVSGQGGESVIGSNGLTTQPNQTQQQKYYQLLYGYWHSRTLFTLQTPWAIFQNMAIMSVKSTQSSETEEISEFAVTFKQLRFATALTDTDATLYSDMSNIASPASQQASSVTNLGTSSLTQSTLPATTSIDSILA